MNSSLQGRVASRALVAGVVDRQLERASWIRRMFEEGARLKAERGEANIFDFTLGNPDLEPPEPVVAALRRVVAENRPRSHAYMPNAGYPEVRQTIARRLAARTGLPYTKEHILMTVGSSGAINTALKAMLDPGDEVIVLAPFFPEYQFYIENHRGRMVLVETNERFQPDLERIAAAITPQTKAILLNSPNNPTGAAYSAAVLRGLDELLATLDDPPVVISDEPYRPLTFDGLELPETAALVRRTLIANSWSKTWAIPGERIGYLAISPRLEEAGALWNACAFTNRILGFINAPAIWQWVVGEVGDTPPDVLSYQRKRDALCEGLARIGYEFLKPEGTFYLFPKSPVPDDLAFIRVLLKEGVLAVPGAGFGRAGYFRLCFAVPRETIERSLPAFERALRAAR